MHVGRTFVRRIFIENILATPSSYFLKVSF
jgi:hypothetical protein